LNGSKKRTGEILASPPSLDCLSQGFCLLDPPFLLHGYLECA